MSSNERLRGDLQNVGNVLGERPCVRQTPLYRKHESGNAMKDLLGMGHLNWGTQLCSDSGVFASKFIAEVPASDMRGAACQHSGDKDSSQFRDVFHPTARYIGVPPPRSAAITGSVAFSVADDFIARADVTPSGLSQSAGSARKCPGTVPARSGSERGQVSASPGGGTKSQRRPSTPSAAMERGWNSSARVAGSGCAVPCSHVVDNPSSSIVGNRPRPKSAGPTPKLSAVRFDPVRVASAFSCGRSRFSQEYARGALPCRINHGTSVHRISWDCSLDILRERRNSFLELCADGLRERTHPQITVARLAFADLLQLDGCDPLGDETLRSVMGHIRLALAVEDEVEAAPSMKVATSANLFDGGLDALRLLANAEGPRITPYLHIVLPPIGKRMFAKAYKDKIQNALSHLAEVGGREAIRIMRARGVAAVPDRVNR